MKELVEAQASSGKAPPRVTAQHALLEAQASSVKAPILTAPSAVATRPRPIVTSSVTCTSHVLLRRCMLCDLPLGRYSGRIQYCVKKIAICTMVVTALLWFTHVEVQSLALTVERSFRLFSRLPGSLFACCLNRATQGCWAEFRVAPCGWRCWLAKRSPSPVRDPLAVSIPNGPAFSTMTAGQY